MAARLIFRSKFQYRDGAVREMVLWRLPKPTKERPHGFKYRLYYGYGSGGASVRYDNERGKGDHRHFENQEEPYKFTTVEQLLADFLSDIERLRRGDNEG
jgi:hypothetical protein